MKERYRLSLRRKNVYYAFDNTTRTFESLKTKKPRQVCNLSGLFVPLKTSAPHKLPGNVGMVMLMKMEDGNM